MRAPGNFFCLIQKQTQRDQIRHLITEDTRPVPKFYHKNTHTMLLLMQDPTPSSVPGCQMQTSSCSSAPTQTFRGEKMLTKKHPFHLLKENKKAGTNSIENIASLYFIYFSLNMAHNLTTQPRTASVQLYYYPYSTSTNTHMMQNMSTYRTSVVQIVMPHPPCIHPQLIFLKMFFGNTLMYSL